MSGVRAPGVASASVESAGRATLRALISDIGQRAVSLNKREQKRFFAARMRQLGLPQGSRVLDFGCGTGLFARTLSRIGLRYFGYDVDPGLLTYARLLRPSLTFVSNLEDARRHGPFDAILANCCFHHISDVELETSTLPDIARMMHAGSVFTLVDVLPLEPNASLVRRAYNRLEQGTFKRTAEHLDRLLRERFVVRSKAVHRSFLLALATGLNPIYNDLVAFDLVLRPEAR